MINRFLQITYFDINIDRILRMNAQTKNFYRVLEFNRFDHLFDKCYIVVKIFEQNEMF